MGIYSRHQTKSKNKVVDAVQHAALYKIYKYITNISIQYFSLY